MSWRIEHANPFALLAELPNELVQTCFLRVPPDLPDPCLLVLLGELHRVLRNDGTLWITFPRLAASVERLHLVEQAGWLFPAEYRQAKSNPYRCVTRCGESVRLCAKQPAFHFQRAAPADSHGLPLLYCVVCRAATQRRLAADEATLVHSGRRDAGADARSHRVVHTPQYIAARVRGLRNALEAFAGGHHARAKVAARVPARKRSWPLPRARPLLRTWAGRGARAAGWPLLSRGRERL